VIVTGGARGIGLELARHFWAAGTETWVVDRDPDALELAAADTGARPIVADDRLGRADGVTYAQMLERAAELPPATPRAPTRAG